MAKAPPRTVPPQPADESDDAAFLEIDADELEQARRDPIVREFARRADAILAAAEARSSATPPDS